MKKITLTLLVIVFFSRHSFAQHYDSTNMPRRMAMAGNELLKFRSEYNIGIAITLIGAAGAGGAALADSQANGGVIGVCAGVSVVGAIICLAAHSHLGRAGVYLKGNSIIIPLTKK